MLSNKPDQTSVGDWVDGSEGICISPRTRGQQGGGEGSSRRRAGSGMAYTTTTSALIVERTNEREGVSQNVLD